MNYAKTYYNMSICNEGNMFILFYFYKNKSVFI